MDAATWFQPKKIQLLKCPRETSLRQSCSSVPSIIYPVSKQTWVPVMRCGKCKHAAQPGLMHAGEEFSPAYCWMMIIFLLVTLSSLQIITHMNSLCVDLSVQTLRCRGWAKTLQVKTPYWPGSHSLDKLNPFQGSL